MLNWMLYFRGHSDDYDEWERLGNPGWGWKDVLGWMSWVHTKSSSKIVIKT